MTELQQARDVAMRRMVGDPAHRDLVGLAFVATGQHQIEQPRDQCRVRPEHLVEVPQAEEDDGIRIRPLGVRMLPHDGGLASSSHPPSPSLLGYRYGSPMSIIEPRSTRLRPPDAPSTTTRASICGEWIID